MKIKKASIVLSAILAIAGQSVFAKPISTILRDSQEDAQNQNKQEGIHNKREEVQNKNVKTHDIVNLVERKETAEKEIERKETAEKAEKEVVDISNSGISYLPHLQIGGARFLNVDSSKWAAGVDLFVPLWQTAPTHLVFTHARIFDRTSKPFEGNIHVGYRYLSEDETRLHGIYGAFDRKRSEFGNYYNQLTFGVETWIDKFFIGANYYQPIGRQSRSTGSANTISEEVNKGKVYRNILVTTDYRSEKAMGGGDVEVGYEVIKGLTAYVGGYYFKASDMSSVCGPKAKLSYDYSLNNGKRIIGVFDKIGLEAGVQHDKPRGTVGYVGLNLRVGLAPHKSSNLQGVARHMVDLVHRDVDVVTGEGVVERTKPTILRDKKGRDVRLIDLGEVSSLSKDELRALLNDTNAVFFPVGDTSKISDEVKKAVRDAGRSINVVGSNDVFVLPHGQTMSKSQLEAKLGVRSADVEKLDQIFTSSSGSASGGGNVPKQPTGGTGSPPSNCQGSIGTQGAYNKCIEHYQNGSVEFNALANKYPALHKVWKRKQGGKGASQFTGINP